MRVSLDLWALESSDFGSLTDVGSSLLTDAGGGHLQAPDSGFFPS